MTAALYRGYSAEELTRQYSARGAVPEHPAIFARWAADSAAFRRQAKARLGLAYGDGERQHLDLFLPEAANPPLLVFFHGGYWQSMDRSDSSFIARTLVERGAAVAVVGYDLCPSVSLDTIAEQARKALEWLWRRSDQLGVDAHRLVVAGHSAGAQLSALALATSWTERDPDLPRDLLKGGVLLSGVFDLEPLIHTPLNQALQLDRAAARRNSPLWMAPPVPVPLVVAVGERESAEFHRQSRSFAAAWEARGCSVTALEPAGCHHFATPEQLNDPDSALLESALKRLGH